MRKTMYEESAHTATATCPLADASIPTSGLPNRLLTAFEVAEFVGCHEETVRRAYLRGLLVSKRFGVRGRKSIAMMCSTGFDAAHPRVRRKRKEDEWLFGRSATRKGVAPARAARTRGGSTSCTTANAGACA